MVTLPETTNHLTLPPSRAADIDAISPIPPGGDMTTTFFSLLFDKVVAANEVRGALEVVNDE